MPTLTQAIEWNNSSEQIIYVIEEFGLFSCDSNEFIFIENEMVSHLEGAGIALK